MPLEVRYDSDVPNDATFVRLVQQYSGDMTPRAMLDELLRVGAVVETDRNWFKVVRREYVPQALAPDFLERVGIGIRDFIHTIEVNLEKEGDRRGLFERTVRRTGGMKAEDLPLFDAYVRDKCQALLEEIDNWLTNLDDPDPERGDRVVETGVGIYHFVVRGDQDEISVKELLETKRRLADERTPKLEKPRNGKKS